MASPDTLRILLATDTHVGYNERDPIRGDDSARTFAEIMDTAKARDVDMVLLSGDLFHDNRPSRKAMYGVMRSLRTACLGERPCEIEVLSDTSAEFQSAGGHVNYEDPDINVAIPVFSIHGNHDDPSGEGRLCALDILSVAGLINYFGRTPENDNITVTPVLLQKGSTKLALYGLSNVRDERLFRTFRDGKVKFLRPDVQQNEWFNLMCLHQNHHGHTDTNYLPENFLQDFLDLVVWGHEHECLITPRLNPEMNFHVIQPGSSIATSLCPGEAVTKHIGILSITGRDFHLEPIRLKTVRPFVMRELALADEPALKHLAKKNSNRTAVTAYLCDLVETLIAAATAEWLSAQDDDDPADAPPLPIVRLRVEYSPPDSGGRFETENPQRFSNRFVGKVANTSDIVQFYRRKSTARRGAGANNKGAAVNTPLNSSTLLEDYGGSIDNVRVENLVSEFLGGTALEILPCNGLGDAVGQFVDKDDKHAVETFVDDALKSYMAKLREYDELSEDKMQEVVDQQRSYLEEVFAKGLVRPRGWGEDVGGLREEQPAAGVLSDDEDLDDGEEEDVAVAAPQTVKRGAAAARGRGTRGRGATAAASTRRAPAARAPATARARAPAAKGRGRAKKAPSEDEDEDDAMILDDDDDDDDEEEEEVAAPPPKPTRTTRKAPTPARARAPARKTPAPRKAATPAARRPAAAAATRQTRFTFSQQASASAQDSMASNALFHRAVVRIPSSDEDIDDEEEEEEDEFVPMAGRGGRR
ncbi:Metallo-dependent phosphatase-like protein [Morchella snyderi]|nr:Metallo-dependent phosphatase-like protein [Morchella snyderi]